MKIAVTYENGQVFQHFGHTENFKVYDIEDGKVISSEIIGSNGTGHGALAGLLAGEEIDVLICGGIGGGVQQALTDNGIELCAGASGDTDAAVEAYLKGELINTGANCDHHSHEEGHSCGDHEGGHCGHHGHGADESADNNEVKENVPNAESDDNSSGCAGCGSDDAEGGCGGCGSDDGGCGGCSGCHSGPVIEGKNVGKTCRVHYTGTFNDGTKFDSSYDRGEPLEFMCGYGMMILGFDTAVANMEKGEIVDVHLTPDEAYGEADPAAIFDVEIAQLPGAEDLTEGEMAYLQDMYGRPIPVRVVKKDDTTITFDANHEMAGKELNFKIELVDILD